MRKKAMQLGMLAAVSILCVGALSMKLSTSQLVVEHCGFKYGGRGVLQFHFKKILQSGTLLEQYRWVLQARKTGSHDVGDIEIVEDSFVVFFDGNKIRGSWIGSPYLNLIPDHNEFFETNLVSKGNGGSGVEVFHLSFDRNRIEFVPDGNQNVTKLRFTEFTERSRIFKAIGFEEFELSKTDRIENMHWEVGGKLYEIKASTRISGKHNDLKSIEIGIQELSDATNSICLNVNCDGGSWECMQQGVISKGKLEQNQFARIGNGTKLRDATNRWSTGDRTN